METGKETAGAFYLIYISKIPGLGNFAVLIEEGTQKSSKGHQRATGFFLALATVPGIFSKNMR